MFITFQESCQKLTSSTKRRIRRNRLKSILSKTETVVVHKSSKIVNESSNLQITGDSNTNLVLNHNLDPGDVQDSLVNNKVEEKNMSSKDNKSREDVLLARQAKKQAKLKGKGKDVQSEENVEFVARTKTDVIESASLVEKITKEDQKPVKESKVNSPKGKDEVDKACAKVETITDVGDKSKEQIKAERAAKKAAKHAKKKGATEQGDGPPPVTTVKTDEKEVPKPVNEDMTVKDVVETLRDIKNVAKEIQDVTLKVTAMDLGGKKVKTILLI